MKRATPLVDKVNKWEGKSEILNGVEDVKWTIVGETDAGVGEGADLKVTGENAWSSLKLEGKTITSDTFMLKFGARVFHRDGETYPEILVIVQTADGTQHVITANGQENNYVFVDTDAIQHFTYDLSAFAGQNVVVAIALQNAATHCAITDITMAGAIAE